MTWLRILLQTTTDPVIVQQAANWVTIALALVAGLPATLSAVIAGLVLLQSRRNAEVAATTEAAVIKASEKSDVIIEKATEIHTLTNSNLSKVQSQLDVANQKIDGFNLAQTESARKIANMELLITSLIPPKGEPSPSQMNGEKLDNLKAMLSDVQHGTPPIPVVDDAVLKKLDEVVVSKLDTIQESADAAAKQTAKDSGETGT